MNSVNIGALQIHRVEELCGAFVTPEQFLTGLPEDAIARHRDWLLPTCIDAATGCMVTSVHTWVVRTAHHTVLIDTCNGNNKSRPDLPVVNQLHTPWLDRLSATGVDPASVDFVMCTHLHADHVGWNTQLKDGRWVPTFPNARYVVSQTELAHWERNAATADGWGQRGVFEDSVLPCIEAGQLETVSDGFALDDQLTVEAALGHTPGNCIVRARSKGRTGLFTGDCMHSPLQIAYPDVNSVACEDQQEARRTRWRILSECAEHGHLLLPAHFPPPFVCQVEADGDAFRYRPMVDAC
jgi:glyoxylase-like metal-dependent hydrolase (beta-lactamase superfamily II)